MLRFLFFSLLLLHSCAPDSSTITGSDSLNGTWSLIADQEIDSTGHVVREDTAVSGLLLYAGNGKMCVQILWRGTRSNIMTDSIMNHDGISSGLGAGSNSWGPEQARKIIDTYDAYFGNYSVDMKTHTVVHSITGNLRPEKAGISYTRNFTLRGDTLLLKSTDPKMRWQTAWIRVKNEQ